ncbi:MAG TPA: dihydrodipicolinate synthase family protein [Bryobacteraceae bacterium]
MARFEGIYTAIVTPFTSTLEVDYGRLEEHVAWLIEQGVQGIIPTGSLGEYASMTEHERAKVVETVAKVTAGKVDLVVGSASPSTKQAVKWVQHAKDHGAAGVMALPPINYRPRKNEIIAHYEALSSVGLPIIAYNNPFDTAVDLTPDLLAELAQIEQVVAVKEFSADVRRIPEILEKCDLEVLVGLDDMLYEGVLAGGTGWIGGLSNTFPKECAELYSLSRTGKLTEAFALYQKLLPLFRYDSKPILVQAIKYTMDLAGMPMGGTRPPRLPLTEEEYREIEAAYKLAAGK